MEARTELELSRGARATPCAATSICVSVGWGSPCELERYLPLLGEEPAQGRPVEPVTSELQSLIDAVTVTHTWFLRDAEQLAVLSRVLETRDRTLRPLSVWIPGCATGEEAYSVALLAARLGRSVDILGTDLNVSALAHARRGHYGAWSIRELAPRERDAFSRADGFRVPDAIRAMVSFERHNLLDPPITRPDRGWDVVLCRNVLIYFTPARARNTLAALGSVLAADGILLVGASDIVLETPPSLHAAQRDGKLVFRRRPPELPAAQPSLEVPATRIPTTPPPRPAPPPRSAPPPRPAPPTLVAETPSALPLRELERDRLLATGHAHLERGAFDRALEAYRAAADSDGLSGAPRMYIGITHHLMGTSTRRPASSAPPRSCHRGLWRRPYLALATRASTHDDALREYRYAARGAREASAIPMEGPLRGFDRDLTELAARRAAKLLGRLG